MHWTENLKQYIRALIMELALHSGAEYEIFLLTHVKDNDIPLYGPESQSTIHQLREKYIPPEFQNMAVVFNEKTLQTWYPKIEEHKYVRPLSRQI